MHMYVCVNTDSHVCLEIAPWELSDNAWMQKEWDWIIVHSGCHRALMEK